ncbi:hypothetical protein DK389_22970 [Methylobacterium durans]|uniref:Uncharacterized protein n=1 Tax=Methylobacterium durans TaxID=2202825 RepID=A0A2U8WB47_9HYPH|nr:hypothetical protein DK389_22970 [Methylobacterium durans]
MRGSRSLRRLCLAWEAEQRLLHSAILDPRSKRLAWRTGSSSRPRPWEWSVGTTAGWIGTSGGWTGRSIGRNAGWIGTSGGWSAATDPIRETAIPCRRPKSLQVVVHQVPKAPDAQATYRALRARRLIGGLARDPRHVRLPRPLILRLTECDGEVNARYAPETRPVTVCYASIQDVRNRAPEDTSPAGATRHEAIMGRPSWARSPRYR